MLVTGVAFALGSNVLAAEGKAKETTIKGKGLCAKCALHETEKCQNAIVVKKGDKETVYYLKGDKAEKFHSQVCKGPKENVTAKGVVTEENGKKWLEVSEVKVAEKPKAQ